MTNDSILESVKDGCGLMENSDDFKQRLISLTNAALDVSSFDLGVGKKGFSITDESDTWDDFLQEKSDLSLAREFIIQYVALQFDPSASSAIAQARKEQLDEIRWRLVSIAEREY